MGSNPTPSAITKTRKDFLAGFFDVIWMRDKEGEFSNHTIDEFGHIPNYSVGRRPKGLSQDVTYEGDDYHFKKDNVMQLQIHNRHHRLYDPK